MIRQIYKCSTCGYEGARWHIGLNSTDKPLCERCLPVFMREYSHIISFSLHRRTNHGKFN